MVFQIVDDILDITTTSEHLGKPAGHDMVEGVYTLPVLRTLAMDHAVGEELKSLLGKPLDLAERDKALAIVRANEGVESAATTARRYVADAEQACDELPAGLVTDALRAAPSALLESALLPCTRGRAKAPPRNLLAAFRRAATHPPHRNPSFSAQCGSQHTGGSRPHCPARNLPLSRPLADERR